MLHADLHIHSRHSGDCDTDMADVCEQALARGLREIAFTDHVDFNPLDGSYAYLKPDLYLADIDRCRRIYGDRLRIRAGVEISEPHLYPQQANALVAAHPFDLVIGSVHWVGERTDWLGAYFDGWTLKEGMHAYFAEIEQLVAQADFDVLAHLDIVRRAVNYRFGLTQLDYAPYEPAIRRILRTMIDRGIALEINTANYRRGLGETCPPLEVLHWYVEMGGEMVTAGSDAHTADSVASSFDVVRDMLDTVGIQRIATFDQRQLVWLRI
ncbi:MAG: histidinol-phosphatase HisJ family protein [Chloroflexi bacterium]|nr:histidinol-phosphatase HisJ family protein [Chloroflexota bacterium]